MNLKTGGVGGEMDKLKKSIGDLRTEINKLIKQGTGGKKPNKNKNEEGEGGVLSQIFMPKILRRIPKDLKTLTNKIGLTGAALGTLGVFVYQVGKRWYQWYGMIQETRREIGLTLPEAQAFGGEVISMTAKYGVAMDRVSNIARFVGKGTELARTGVVELAGSLALTGEASQTSEKQMADFGFFLNRTLEMSKKQADAVSDAVLGMAHGAHIPLRDLQRDLMAGEKAIFQAQQTIGGPRAVAAFAALASGMREAGASSEQVGAALKTMGDKGSMLFQLFAGADYQMEPFRKHLANIEEGVRSGAIAAASLGDVYEGLGAITLVKLSQSAKGTEENMQDFYNVLQMSPEEREAWKRSLLSPMQRIGMAFRQFWADQTDAANKLAGGPIHNVLTKTAELAESAIENFRISTKWLGGEIYRATVFWEEKLKQAHEVVKQLAVELKAVGSFINDLTGKTERLNRAAENRVPLLSPIARNKKIQEGWTNVQANTWYREQLRLRAQNEGAQALTPQERTIVFGARAATPDSAAPKPGKDPSIEVMKGQMEVLKRTLDSVETMLKRQEIDRVRSGGSSGGGTPAPSANPYVESQRS